MQYTSGEKVKSGQAVTGDVHDPARIDDDEFVPDRFVGRVNAVETAEGVETGKVHVNVHLYLLGGGGERHCTPSAEVVTVAVEELRLL